MPLKEFEVAVCDSIGTAQRNSKAFNEAMDDLSIVIAERRWGDFEAIRERMHAAVDGYVDSFATAARAVEQEREQGAAHG